MTDPPLVSVVMPAFNRERYIAEAVRSMQAQTLGDFELIVVDDGSTDRTVEIAAASGDPRIRIIEHGINRGTPAARNSGLEAARGQFIAWLDSDDLSRPTRLAEQVKFLNANPSVRMAGTCAGKIDEHGRRKRGVRVPPLGHDDILAMLLFRTAFQQSSIMGRAEVLKRFPYRAEFPVSQDIDVFIRLTAEHRAANMPMVLIDRRLHAEQTVRTRQAMILDAKRRQLGPMLRDLGIDFTPEDLDRHIMLGSGGLLGVRPDREFIDWAEHWLHRLLGANRTARAIEPAALEATASSMWLTACRRAARHTSKPWLARRMLSSALSRPVLNGAGRAWMLQALRLNAGLGR